MFIQFYFCFEKKIWISKLGTDNNETFKQAKQTVTQIKN
jgi:hypothetical protein